MEKITVIIFLIKDFKTVPINRLLSQFLRARSHYFKSLLNISLPIYTDYLSFQTKNNFKMILRIY